MTREQVEERIVDPAGPPRPGTPEREAFDAWLECDAELRERFELQQEVFAAMDLWEAPQPSAGFDAALRAKLQPKSFWAGLFGARPWWAAAAVAALAAWLYWAPPRTVDLPEPAEPAQVVAVDEVDQVLDDLEMLVEFEALPPAEAESGEGRS